MLHILLEILKTIGILFGILLILALIVLLLILFVQLKYKVCIKKYDNIDIKAKVSWMFHAVSLTAFYNEELVVTIRIFGIKFETYKNIAAKLRVLKNKIVRMRRANKAADKEKISNENKKRDIIKTKEEQKVKTDNTNNKQTDNLGIKQDESKQNKTEQEDFKEDKKTSKIKLIIEKIKSFIKHIIEILKKIWEFITNFREKLYNIKRKLSEIRAFLKDENNKEAFTLCKEQLIVLLKYIKPNKYKGDIKFGFDDPSITGQVLGVCGMLMPLYKDNIKIRPDFEQTVFEGELFLKGNIRLYKLLIVAIKIIKDKNVRTLYNKFLDRRN